MPCRLKCLKCPQPSLIYDLVLLTVFPGIVNGEKKSPVGCVPKLSMCPKGINCQGLRKGALCFLACLCAPRSQSPLGSVCPWAISTTDVPSVKHSTAEEQQPLSSLFFCITTGSEMHAQTHIVHTSTLALNTTQLIFLPKVLC